MKFFSLEAILCASHITFNEKIIFCYLNPFHSALISVSSIARILYRPIMGYILIAIRAGQPPIWVFTLTATPQAVSWRIEVRPH